MKTVEPVVAYGRNARSINFNHRLNGRSFHGWIDPGLAEITAGFSESFNCIFLNSYYTTIIVGDQGWTSVPNIDPAVTEFIRDFLIAYYS